MTLKKRNGGYHLKTGSPRCRIASPWRRKSCRMSWICMRARRSWCRSMRRMTRSSGGTTSALLWTQVVSSWKIWTGRICVTYKWSRSHGIDSVLTISNSSIIIRSHLSGTRSNRNPNFPSRRKNRRGHPPQSRPPLTKKHPVAPVRRKKGSERFISRIKNKSPKVIYSQSFMLHWNKMNSQIKSKNFTSLIRRCLIKIAIRAPI